MLVKCGSCNNFMHEYGTNYACHNCGTRYKSDNYIMLKRNCPQCQNQMLMYGKVYACHNCGIRFTKQEMEKIPYV